MNDTGVAWLMWDFLSPNTANSFLCRLYVWNLCVSVPVRPDDMMYWPSQMA